MVTHDKELARSYGNDPLVLKVANARWFTETHAAQDRALARANRVTLPLCVVMGGADPIAQLSRALARSSMRRVPADKVWETRPGLFHEVLNEPEWPDIAARYADFVLGHR